MVYKKEMIEEVRIILDNLLINNDKYIVEYILSYVHPRCIECKLLYKEEKTFELYNGRYVCIYCYKSINYKKCYSCNKMYKFKCNIFCSSCLGNCRIYCCNCLSIEYRTEIFGSRTISLIDDIILNVANRLINNGNVANDILNDLFEDYDIEDID